MLPLILNRRPSTQFSTIGEVLVKGNHQCWTCEDIVREPLDGRPSPEGKNQFQFLVEMNAWVKTWKVMSKTAIPSGTYRVIITMSNRFKMPLPLLVDVPGFTGIRIHPGNDAVDTDGCILPGITIDNDRVRGSRVANAELYTLISETLLKGEAVTLTVNNG